MKPKMTAYELKTEVECHGHEPHFFDSRTMKYFGDTMKNYGCRPAVIDTWTETGVKCWELYRRRPSRRGLKDSAYFHAETFQRMFKKAD